MEGWAHVCGFVWIGVGELLRFLEFGRVGKNIDSFELTRADCWSFKLGQLGEHPNLNEIRIEVLCELFDQIRNLLGG